MSTEKLRHEAQRWLDQAKADMRAADGSLAAGSFEWACFQSQQAGVKALKALYYSGGYDPWGHSITKLIQDLPDKTVAHSLKDFVDHARHLDKLYIPTRYPNGLPDLTPFEVYTEEDARKAIDTARELIEEIASTIEG